MTFNVKWGNVVYFHVLSSQEQGGEEHVDEPDEDIIESDVELDNTDVVEPDNDPAQQVSHGGVRWMQLRCCLLYLMNFFLCCLIADRRSFK